MEWDKIGLLFRGSRFKTYIHITNSTLLLLGNIVILDIDSSESVEIVNIESIPIQVGMLTAGSFDISHNQWFGVFGQSTLSQTPLHEGDELS